MERSYIKGCLEVLVLRVLEREKRLHGYAILQKLREIDPEYFDASEGSLYPLLAKLEKDKAIVGEWEAKRKCYRLTTRGARQLHVELSRWNRFCQTLNAYLNPDTPAEI